MLLRVLRIQFDQIACNRLIHLRNRPFQSLSVEVALVVIERLELRAVDCDQRAAKQLLLLAEAGKSTADRLKRFEVIFTKIGDSLVVWCEPFEKPHDFD